MHRNISVIWSSGFAIHTPVFCICPIEEVLRLIWGRLLLLRKPLIYLWLPWKVRQWKCGRKPNKPFSVKKPQACFQWKADLQFFFMFLCYISKWDGKNMEHHLQQDSDKHSAQYMWRVNCSCSEEWLWVKSWLILRSQQISMKRRTRVY